jgi:hypothetical protein
LIKTRDLERQTRTNRRRAEPDKRRHMVGAANLPRINHDRGAQKLPCLVERLTDRSQHEQTRDRGVFIGRQTIGKNYDTAPVLYGGYSVSGKLAKLRPKSYRTMVTPEGHVELSGF